MRCAGLRESRALISGNGGRECAGHGGEGKMPARGEARLSQAYSGAGKPDQDDASGRPDVHERDCPGVWRLADDDPGDQGGEDVEGGGVIAEITLNSDKQSGGPFVKEM